MAGAITTQRSLPSADMPPFEDDSVEDLFQRVQFRMLRSSMKSRSLDGDSPSTPVSFSIRDDRAAASESLQYLLGLANAGADQCVEGPVLKARNSMRQQRPIVVVACHDWELPKYLQDAEENGHVVIIRCKGLVVSKGLADSVMAAVTQHSACLVAYVGHCPCVAVENAVQRWLDRHRPGMAGLQRTSPTLSEASDASCEAALHHSSDATNRPSQGLKRRKSGGFFMRLFSCGSAECEAEEAPVKRQVCTLPSSPTASPRAEADADSHMDCGQVVEALSSASSSGSSASSAYLAGLERAVDSRLFQLVEQVAVARTNLKCKEMEEASLEAALERGWPVRGPTICHPTYKMKIQQIQQDFHTVTDVVTTAVKEEAQVLLKEMARETGHKSLNGLEVVALTCAPHTGSLQVVRRAWCSSVGRGFFYE